MESQETPSRRWKKRTFTRTWAFETEVQARAFAAACADPMALSVGTSGQRVQALAFAATCADREFGLMQISCDHDAGVWRVSQFLATFEEVHGEELEGQ